MGWSVLLRMMLFYVTLQSTLYIIHNKLITGAQEKTLLLKKLDVIMANEISEAAKQTYSVIFQVVRDQLGLHRV